MNLNYSFIKKNVLITGATGTIGCAYSKSIAELGGKVIMIDKDKEKLIDLCEELKKINNIDHDYYVVDLENQKKRNIIVDKLIKKYEYLDVLVNNAAYTGSSNLKNWLTDFENQSLETWNAAMEVNLTSCFDLTKRISPILRNSSLSNVLNVCSIYSFIGPDYSLYQDNELGNPAAYAASKGGLVQLTRWLASTLAPEVRVNAISPGGIFASQNPKFVSKYVSKTPLKRMAKIDDIIPVMVFLTSDHAKYILGQNIIVDGGYSIL